jgi:hypothetical protein
MLARCQRGGIHRRAPTLAGWGARARMMSSWSLDGIEYRRLAADHDPEALFAFNKEHGSTPLNFIPDEPVRAHFGRLATGETTVWGAFAGEELAGFISGEVGGGYWRQTGPGQEATSDNDGATCFINEFVVNPKFRGKRIGVRLTSASVDPELGIWAANPAIKEMYTTKACGGRAVGQCRRRHRRRHLRLRPSPPLQRGPAAAGEGAGVQRGGEQDLPLHGGAAQHGGLIMFRWQRRWLGASDLYEARRCWAGARCGWKTATTTPRATT